MSMYRGSWLVLLYVVADLFISLISIGYYSPNWTLHTDLIYKHIFLVDGYSFLSSGIEFVVLSVQRVLLMMLAVVLIALHKEYVVKQLLMPAVCFAVACYSFGMVKFLAFAENSAILRYPGIWFSTIWSILASGLFACIWYFVLSAHVVPERYLRLITATTSHESQSDDVEVSSEAGLDSNGEVRLGTLQHVRRLLAYCAQQWPLFSSGFVFLTIYAVARVFIPAYTGQVIGDIVKSRGLGSLLHSVFVMGILTTVSSFFGGLRGGCFDYATAKVNRQVRGDLFRSLVRQDIAFYDNTKTGEVLSRLTSDCQTMSDIVATNLNVFLRNGVMLIGALVYMFVLSWRLSLVTFIAVPLIGFITQWYGSYYDKLAEITQDTMAKANQMAEEVLSTMRTVRSFAGEKREAARFDAHLDKTLAVHKKKSIAYMGFTWTNEFCDNAILVGVLFYGGHLVITEKMTSNQLITFLLYQMQLGENLYNIGWVFTGLMESVGASRKVMEYMRREPAMSLEGTLTPTVQGRIDLKQVDFSYPSRPNNAVLKGLDLTIEAGQTVALVGPSGGGKSSIVSLIEHFYEPNAGDVLLDGVPVKDISHTLYHQKVALVAQEPVLYDGSVRNNILYGCDFATEDDMLEAARTANVHNFVSELEKGYDTNCGEKGVQMSGGQKQRIAIARALVRRPAVLILDEATSALDSESEALVQEALSRCARERTVLIIAHRLSTIEKADMIAVIQKGCVMQTGRHSELMENKNGLYYSLVSRQILGSTDE